MSQIQQVKDATDIIQIIGERLTLQRSGAQYRALCPFHGEKSPSFFVNEQFQRYKCFGCGESGDSFTFLQKYDGMTFGESLKYLADRANITLESFTPSDEDAKRQRYLSILSLSKEYYHYLLTEHEVGEKARAYLKERGITAESIKIFQLGYSMSAWDGLLAYLHGKKKFSVEDIQATGMLVMGKHDRAYDRFRERLMFPLTNHLGQVVGFSGRLLDNQAKEAKYINTPETSLYHKSKMLFGLSELYQPIRQKKEVVVVEGEFDVISSAQAHVNHVVAIKGSALTADHVQLLHRVADRVLLSLDTDAAGVEATKRAIGLCQAGGIELRVIQIPDGKDPDELARHNPAAWRQAAKSSVSVYEFFFQAALKKFDASTPEGKRQIMMELGPIFNTIPLAVELEVYIKKLATALEVSVELVRQDLRRVGLPARPAQSRRSRTAEAAPTQKPAPTLQSLNKLQKLETYLVFLMLQLPRAKCLELWPQLSSHHWAQHELGTALQALIKIEHHQTLSQALKELPDDQQQLLFEVSVEPEFVGMTGTVDPKEELERTLSEVAVEAVKVKIDTVTKQIDELDGLPETDPQREVLQEQYLRELVVLQAELQKLLKK